jgi:hypothetical protein
MTDLEKFDSLCETQRIARENFLRTAKVFTLVPTDEMWDHVNFYRGRVQKAEAEYQAFINARISQKVSI